MARTSLGGIAYGNETRKENLIAGVDKQAGKRTNAGPSVTLFGDAYWVSDFLAILHIGAIEAISCVIGAVFHGARKLGSDGKPTQFVTKQQEPLSSKRFPASLRKGRTIQRTHID